MSSSATTTPSPSSASASASPSSTSSASSDSLQSFKSRVVLTATIGGLLVLAVAALILLFKISRWVRSYRESKRRKRLVAKVGPGRKGRNAYEIFEWEGVPA